VIDGVKSLGCVRTTDGAAAARHAYQLEKWVGSDVPKVVI